MKTTKRILALVLSALVLVSGFAFSTQASGTKELSIISYNVAGLPVGTDVPFNQAALGNLFNETGYDIIAVQEDFTYHNMMVEDLSKTLYPYWTNHTGGVPGGDGLNIFSKYKLYNEERTTWRSLSGVIEGGADELTPKGILYTCIELEDGVYLDFYTVHADAYGDPDSVAARSDNFRQLAEIINKRGTKNPVIVAGDFNTAHHYFSEASRNVFREVLIDGCGFKDNWVELVNGGDYDKFVGYPGDHFGYWDSLDKVLYRDGDGVKLTATEFEYKFFLNNKGESISDHAAALSKFTYEKTENFTENEENVEVVKPDKNRNIFAFVKTLIMDIIKLLTDFDKILALIGINK